MDNAPIDRSGLPAQGVEGVQPTGPTKRSSDAQGAGGPAFRALLEKLQNSAAELAKDSEGVASPDHLAGAVDRARASLEDALSLGDRLLEAYREATQQAEGVEGEEEVE